MIKETRRTSVYVMTAAEREAVYEGLAQAERGEFVSDADMTAFWRERGVDEKVVRHTSRRAVY